MLSKVKLYAGIALSAFIALLMGLVKYQSNRADKAEQEAQEAELEAMSANQRAESKDELIEVTRQAKQRELESEKRINEIKNSNTRPDSFSDGGMLDD